jgi:hypothetical protein
VVVLRDDRWQWWCRCGWHSVPAPTLTLVATGHLCGSGDRPSDGAWVAAPVPFSTSAVLAYPSTPAYRAHMGERVVHDLVPKTCEGSVLPDPPARSIEHVRVTGPTLP